MSETFPTQLQVLIDRAGSLTADESDALGKSWEEDEGWILPEPSVATQLFGGLDAPQITNATLVDAWQRALDASGNAGRVTEIEAARAAGRAAVRDVRHTHENESTKNGAEEAVRAAVLAVGVRDLISDVDYQTLVGPWQRVLGEI
jgi:hypothetical protein